LGIARITDNAMSLSVRAVSVARGSDPRDCAMIAFGGAGPLHALSIARDISIPTVVIPQFPGNFSALGMLLAPWRQDFVRTFVAELAEVPEGDAARVTAELAEMAKASLAAEGIAEASADFQFTADLRYLGQEHTIAINLASPNDLTGGGSEALRADFDAAHNVRYGHAAPNERIQVAKIRLAVTVARGGATAAEWLTVPFSTDDAQPEETRDVIFTDPGQRWAARILWRPGLAPGTEVEGPAVIEEPNSTTLIYPGDQMRISEHGHMIIEVGPA
jgi:N-methylhydantoinase A